MEPNDESPEERSQEARPPLPADLAGEPGGPAGPAWASSVPPLPPLPPDLAGPTTPLVAGDRAGTSAPGTPSGSGATPDWAVGAGMPPGGQPPYSPPYGWAWPSGGQQAEPSPAPARNRRRTLVASLAGIALVAGGLGAGLGVAFGSGSPGGGSTSSTVPPLPKSSETALSPKSTVGQIATAVEPAIVDIDVNDASPAGSVPEPAAGTGMIVTSSGEVLTNNHVVEDATSIRVVVPHHGTYVGKVLGVDPTQDVALVQIEHAPADLPYVTLGDSSTVSLGQSVVAIGNAYGLGGTPSLATGVVSALGRTINASDESPTASSETLHGLIQTDAPIASGDSGGPLLDSKGQVIGMDTAAASGDGGTLGFAIPINTARSIVEQIEQGKGSSTVIIGTSPFLGIYEVENQGQSQSSPYGGSGFSGFSGLPGYGSSSTTTVSGVEVYDVIQGSPAQKAGLAADDTITAIDGQKTATWSALSQAIASKKVGGKITVSYVDTSGTSHTVTVTLAGLPK